MSEQNQLSSYQQLNMVPENYCTVEFIIKKKHYRFIMITIAMQLSDYEWVIT